VSHDEPTPVFREIQFEKAEEFLNYLRLSNPGWGDERTMLKSPFIFRGQWDSSWELSPPAWRHDGQKKLVDYDV
jgi:hypothetical protein